MATQEAAVDSLREAVPSVETFETVVIGGGQAGLAVGYYLKKRGRSFVILDANDRIGGSWRTRTWNSLRLFTPARYDGLPGWPFPAPGWSYPTAREAADYLEAYATRFDLPVRTGMAVTRLAKDGDRYRVECGERRFEAEIVAQTATRVDLSERPFGVWAGDEEWRADTVVISTGASARTGSTRG